jgi:tetratricopeptide (TPR) repeat protein
MNAPLKAAACLLICLCLLVPLQSWLDAQPKPNAPLDEALYLRSGRALKAFSFGFHGWLADLYWLRTIQYFGSKVEAAQSGNAPVNLAEVGQWKLDALPVLLDIVTELDPQFIAAYRFGAAFLPEAHAIELLTRGLRENPTDWRLALDLGYVYWRQGRFAEARAAYERGSKMPGAPAWLPVLAATVAARGNDVATARAILLGLYESSTDEYVRALSLARLQALEAKSEVEQQPRETPGTRGKNGLIER